MDTKVDTTNHQSVSFAEEHDILVNNIGGALRENAFSNRMLLSPRRLEQIAREEVTTFVEFLANRDTDLSHKRGRHLAQQGLGHRALLAMSTALRRSFLELNGSANGKSAKLWDIVENYITAQLEGYMLEREEDIQREQDRTREAYFRAVDRQAETNGY